jgi:hypothetical protein
VLEIDPAHRLVEGVASNGNTIFVSSVLDRQILACRLSCRTLVTLPGNLSPLGIAWDWSRDLIWVAADCPDLPGIPACKNGALIAIGPSGKVVATFAPPLEFHPGDVSVSLLSIFVSDSRNGSIYGLLARRRGLRLVNREKTGKSAQGTALSPEGTSLVIADYSRGIGKVDLRTGETRWLPLGSGRQLQGIDGLVRCGERYFAVYNGSSPGHVLSMRISGGKIEARDFPTGYKIPDPTQIAFDGKRLLVVSGSGWQDVDKANGSRRAGARILEIPLANGCNS